MRGRIERREEQLEGREYRKKKGGEGGRKNWGGVEKSGVERRREAWRKW